MFRSQPSQSRFLVWAALATSALGCASQKPYFDRLRARVGKNWDPGTPLRDFDPNGTKLGGHDYYTILNITMHADGTLADVQVARSSGVPFLDAAALTAFSRAEPFESPPPELLRAGVLRFPFGLYLEAGGGGRNCRSEWWDDLAP